MGLPETLSQPSEEFDGAPGESLEARNDEGHVEVGFFHALRAFCQDFFPALFLRLIGDAGFGEGGLKEDHQVMEQAEEPERSGDSWTDVFA